MGKREACEGDMWTRTESKVLDSKSGRTTEETLQDFNLHAIWIMNMLGWRFPRASSDQRYCSTKHIIIPNHDWKIPSKPSPYQLMHMKDLNTIPPRIYYGQGTIIVGYNDQHPQTGWLDAKLRV